MPKKAKGKAKNAKGKKQEEANFHEIPFLPEIVQTSIVVLASVEDAILLKALKEILDYANECSENLSRLYNKGLLSKLPHLVHSNNQKVLSLAMRLLDQFVEYEEVLDFFQLDSQHVHVTHIVRLYLVTTNKYIKECLAKVLSRFASRGPLFDLILAEDVEIAVWATLRSAKDATLQAYTLLLLYYLSLRTKSLTKLLEVKDFSLKFLMCFLRSEYQDIRTVAMEIQCNISRSTVRSLMEKVCAEKIVGAMVRVVLDPDKAAFQAKALAIVAAYVKNYDNASDFVRTLEFVRLSRWVHDCDEAHIAVAARIFSEICKFRDLIQFFVDFSVDVSVLSLFRCSDYVVVSELCLILSRISDHFFCCEKLACASVIAALVGVLTQGYYDYVPTKDAAVETVYKLLKNVENCKVLFYNHGGLRATIHLYRTARNRFAPATFLKIMEIMHMYASAPPYAEDLMTKDLYHLMFEQFLDDVVPEFSAKAIAVLDRYVENKPMRDYFLEIKGPRRIVRHVQRCAGDAQTLGNVLVFMRNMSAYKNVAMKFLQENVTSALKGVSAEVAERLPAVKAMLEMFYGLNLPLKFYETGRLDVSDKLTDNFYLVNGRWTGKFPFYEDLRTMKLSISTTFYLVSFVTPARDALSKVKPPSSIYDYKNHRAFSSLGILKKVNSSQKFKTADYNQYELANTILSMAKRVPAKFEFGTIPPDPYISVMIEQVYLQIFSVEDSGSLEQKARCLAMYVAKQMSGCGDLNHGRKGDVLHRQSYPYHINALKQKMGVNVIPIGYLRMGQQCERALLYKVLADKVEIPCTLVRGPNNNYWNEVALALPENNNGTRYVSLAVVDLMKNIGNLYLVGCDDANAYCGPLHQYEKHTSKISL